MRRHVARVVVGRERARRLVWNPAERAEAVEGQGEREMDRTLVRLSRPW